jgi:ankyrin repeat protein
MDQKGIASDQKDAFGKTPFAYACWKCNDPIAELLLDRGGVDINSTDTDNGTPLHHLLCHPDEGIVRRRDPYEYLPGPTMERLLRRDDLNLFTVDPWNKTEILRILERGMKSTVQQLMRQRRFCADTTDAQGRNLLHFAAAAGDLGLVRQLLSGGGFHADSKDHYGQTPLAHAVKPSHMEVARFFLGRADVDADSRDFHGRTPLARAYGPEMARMILERNDVDPNSRDETGATPLLRAINADNLMLVKYLAGRADVDLEAVTLLGLGPGIRLVQFAELSGYNTIADFLRQRISVRARGKTLERLNL